MVGLRGYLLAIVTRILLAELAKDIGELDVSVCPVGEGLKAAGMHRRVLTVHFKIFRSLVIRLVIDPSFFTIIVSLLAKLLAIAREPPTTRVCERCRRAGAPGLSCWRGPRERGGRRFVECLRLPAKL